MVALCGVEFGLRGGASGDLAIGWGVVTSFHVGEEIEDCGLVDSLDHEIWSVVEGFVGTVDGVLDVFGERKDSLANPLLLARIFVDKDERDLDFVPITASLARDDLGVSGFADAGDLELTLDELGELLVGSFFGLGICQSVKKIYFTNSFLLVGAFDRLAVSHRTLEQGLHRNYKLTCKGTKKWLSF